MYVGAEGSSHELKFKDEENKNMVSFTAHCSQRRWPDIVVSNALLSLAKKSKFSGAWTPTCQGKPLWDIAQILWHGIDPRLFSAVFKWFVAHDRYFHGL